MKDSITLQKLTSTQAEFNQISLNGKTEVFLSKQEEINFFLDTIIEYKKFLTDKAGLFNELTLKLEELTWISNREDKMVILIINVIIALSKEIYRIYKSALEVNKKLQKLDYAVSEIENYNTALEDFIETIDDIEFSFFYFPNSEASTTASSYLGSK